jgi:signal transduction histidine kinase
MNLFTLHTLPPLLSSILFLFLGGFVYLNNRKSIVNITFALVCFVTFWWQFSWFILFNTQNEVLANYLVKIGYIGIIFIPIFFFHFFLSFLREVSTKFDRYLLYFSYLMGLAFEAILLTTNYFINGFYEYSWGFYPKAGFLHPLYLLALTALAIRGLYLLFSFLKKKTVPTEYRQEKYLLWALIFYIFASVDFLLNYGVEFYPFGFLFISIFLGITAYTIVKHYLFGIKVILTELLVGVMATVLLIQLLITQALLWKIINSSVLILFIIFGYFLIKATIAESKRREEAESLAYRERVLRKATEDILREKEILAEKFQVIAIKSTAFKESAEELAQREKVFRQKAEKLANDFQRFNEVRNQMFLTGYHHSRTPLAHIKNFASLLLEETYGPITKEQKWALQTIFNKVQESIDLANLYLSVAELESGKKVISKEKTKLEKIVRDQIKKLSYEAKLKNIKIVAKIEAHLPEILVDPEKIGVVYYALLENALKYAPKKGGKITLGLKNTLRQAQGKTEKDTILFYCQDNGIGIKREEIQNLGQVPYQRTERAKDVHGTGKGLALYLSRLIVKTHQGKIWAESEGEGKGTTFYVELPIN